MGNVTHLQPPSRNPLPRDVRLSEMLSRFNREKVPERAVHARGAGAYGEFEVTVMIFSGAMITALIGAERLPTTSPVFAISTCC